jgi:hypothetical protein
VFDPRVYQTILFEYLGVDVVFGGSMVFGVFCGLVCFGGLLDGVIDRTVPNSHLCAVGEALGSGVILD